MINISALSKATRNVLMVFVVFLLFLWPSKVTVAQCAFGGSLYTTTDLNTATFNTWYGASNYYGGEYMQVNNAKAGDLLFFSSCVLGANAYDNQFTLFGPTNAAVAYNDDNGPLCSGSSSSISYLVPSGGAGNYRLLNNVYNCATNSLSGQVYVLKYPIGIGAETTPSHTAASGCVNGTLRVGAGAYTDITIAANTYYDWSFNNNGATNINSFYLQPLNGNATALSQTNATAWFSGTTTSVRIHGWRTSSNWVATSGILTYRNTQPTAGSVTQSPASGGTVCAGSNVSYTSSGSASGNFSYFEYQWNSTAGAYSGSWSTANPTNWTSGLNGASVLYVRSVINNNGCTSASAPVSITVLSTANNPGAITVSSAVCIGTNPLTISNSTVATTGTPASTGPNYYFYYRGGPSNIGWTMYDGPTTNSSSNLPAAVYNTPGQWYVARNSEFGCAGQANNASTIDIPVRVDAATVAGSVSGGTTICEGGSTGTLTLSGYTGSVLNWEKSNNAGASWTNIVNTATTYSETNSTPGTWLYRAVVKNGVCSTIGSSATTVTVQADPNAPTATKSPNTASVCAGSTISLTSPTYGSLPGMSCGFEYRYSTDNGTNWTAWSSTSPSVTAVTGTNLIEIRVIGGCGNGCNASSATQYSWTVDGTPVAPTLGGASPANGTAVCAGFNTGTVTGANGSGGGSNEYQVSINGGSTYSAYTSGSAITTTGATGSIIVQGRRSGGACSPSSWSTLCTWNLAATPTAPTLSSASPANGTTVCAGFNTGTVTGAAGSGGSTGAADEYQVSINGGSTYIAYTSGSSIVTTGATGSIIVQARRTGGSYGCTASAWNTICTWNVAETPTAPTLSSASPANGTTVCAGFNTGTVTGTGGSGGSTGAANEYQVSIDGGSSWASYTNGGTINTGAATGNIIVQSRRTGGSYGCTASAWSTICTWNLGSAPVGPTLNTPTPADAISICIGYNGPSATFNAGSNGSTGAADEYRYSIDNGNNWVTYTPGNAINTTGGSTAVRIQSRRSGGSYGCSATAWTDMVSWPFGTSPTQPTLNIATPTSGVTICDGYAPVNATITAGSGGSAGAADVYEYSTNAGSTYSTYTPGTNITTTGATGSVIIRAMRTGGNYGCSNTAWNTIAQWTVNSASVSPTLSSASPANGTTICAGLNVSATATAGSGGSQGAADEYQVSTDNGASWNTYTSGSLVPTNGATGSVIIQSRRTSGTYGCSTTAWTTIASWSISSQPDAGTVTQGTTPQCIGSTSTYTVTGVVLGGGTGAWSSDNTGVATVNSTTGVVTPLAAGTCNIVYTVTGGCGGTETSSASFTVHQPITGLTATPTANPICQGSDLGLTATYTTGTGITSWSWNGPGGYTSSSQNPTRTGIQEAGGEGNYQVSATNACGTVSSNVVNVNVHVAIQFNNATFSPSAICEGSDVQLNATLQLGSDVSWSWTGPGGYSSTGTQNPLVDGSTYTATLGGSTYQYEVTGTNICGAVTEQTGFIQIDDYITANSDITPYAPSTSYANASDVDLDNSAIEVCGSMTATLLANTPSLGSGTWSLGSGPGSVTSWGTSASNPSVTPTVNAYGTYNFVWTVVNGMCSSDAPIRVVFDPAINVTTEVAGCSFISPVSSDLIKITATGGGVLGLTVYSKPVGDNLLVDVSAGANNLTHVYTAPFDGVSHQYRVDDQICVKTGSATTRNGQPADISTPISPSTPKQSTCIDKNFSNWMTFLDDNGNAIAAINDNGNNLDLGEVTVKVWQEANEPQILPNTGSNCQGYTNAAMKRHFMVSSTNFSSGTDFGSGNAVNVRLFFTDAELQSLITKSTTGDNDPATDACSHNDDISNITELYVTKYSGANENGDYTDNDAGGIYKVYGVQTPYSVNWAGNLTPSSNGFTSTYSTNSGLHSVELTVHEFSEFWLHGSGTGSPLPVELLYIEASAMDNSYIQVRWATALEIDNNGFQIERSTDGQNWSAIGWVDGHNNTTTQQNYSYDDQTVTAGIRYYYRLKQIDNDGDYEYTGIVSAIITNGITFNVKDFIPNPATNSTTLVITASSEQTIEVDIFNAIGQKVMSERHTLAKGGNQLPFNLTNLAAGSYTAVVSSNNEVYSKKLIVVK